MSTTDAQPLDASAAPMAAPAAMTSSLEAVETATRALSLEVSHVTQRLSARSAASARATVAHASATTDLARGAVREFDTLRERCDGFLEDARALQRELGALDVLAAAAAEVRAELIRLEFLVAKMPVRVVVGEVDGVVQASDECSDAKGGAN